MSRCIIYDDGLCSGCSGEKCEFWEQCAIEKNECPIPITAPDIPLKVVLTVPIILAALFFVFLRMVA